MTSKTLLTFLIGLAAGGVLATAVASSSGGLLRLCPIPSVSSADTSAPEPGAAEAVVPK